MKKLLLLFIITFTLLGCEKTNDVSEYLLGDWQVIEENGVDVSTDDYLYYFRDSYFKEEIFDNQYYPNGHYVVVDDEITIYRFLWEFYPEWSSPKVLPRDVLFYDVVIHSCDRMTLESENNNLLLLRR